MGHTVAGGSLAPKPSEEIMLMNSFRHGHGCKFPVEKFSWQRTSRGCITIHNGVLGEKGKELDTNL